MIYTEDDETFLMACLDDKVISDLTRCEPFICTPRATIYIYMYVYSEPYIIYIYMCMYITNHIYIYVIHIHRVFERERIIHV